MKEYNSVSLDFNVDTVLATSFAESAVFGQFPLLARALTHSILLIRLVHPMGFLAYLI